MRNPYIEAIERRLNEARKFSVVYHHNGLEIGNDEFNLLIDLLKEFQKIDKRFSIPVVSKLRKIADQCEAGGHKSRARMFRAIAKEFEVSI